MKLKVALRVARQDLTKAQVDLNTMQANYGDVVPRRDFELQERKYNDLADKVLRAETWQNWQILHYGEGDSALGVFSVQV